MISTTNIPFSLPLDSLETLHTLKGIYPCDAAVQCIEQLTKNDCLLLIESGVNNLLMPSFLQAISKLEIHVYTLQDDTLARKIEPNDIKMVSYEQFVDLSVASQRIINWF